MSRRGAVRGLGAVLVAALALVGCGGDDAPYCGDGIVDDGEECDDGNDDQTDFCQDCRQVLPARLIIKWAFNKMAAPGFDADACVDMQASTVEVELSGPTSVTESDGCSFRQVVFMDMPEGTYQVKVTPRDSEGESLVIAPVEAEVVYSGQNMEHEVVVPYEAWSRSYTGTLFFRVLWGGLDCVEAMPPVAQQRLLLERDGEPVAGATNDGVPLDGSEAGACQTFSASFPQRAQEIDWGPATLTITGLDAEGEPQFEETFDTFVGAGANNPELHFDVDSLTPDGGMDGGVDGGPDGGPDGGLDAGVDAGPDAG